MSRKKGFKLSADQKEKMQEGRRKRALKAREGMIDEVEKTKKEKPSFSIIGYGYCKETKLSYPVFFSEKHIHSEKLYKTPAEAKEGKGK